MTHYAEHLIEEYSSEVIEASAAVLNEHDLDGGSWYYDEEESCFCRVAARRDDGTLTIEGIHRPRGADASVAFETDVVTLADRVEGHLIHPVGEDIQLHARQIVTAFVERELWETIRTLGRAHPYTAGGADTVNDIHAAWFFWCRALAGE